MKTQILSRIIACLIIVFCSLYSFSKNIYVNDAKTSLDIYCTVAGSSSNDGLSPATPKATLSQAIGIAASGDVIYVDAGQFEEIKLNLISNISIVGAGPTLTNFTFTGTSGATNTFAIIDGLKDITISNLKLYGYLYSTSKMGSPGPEGYGEAITIMNSENIILKNIYFSKSKGNYGDAAVCIGDHSKNIKILGTSSTCQSSGAAYNGSGFMIQSNDPFKKGVATDVSVEFDGCLIGGNDMTNSTYQYVGAGIIIQGDNTVKVDVKNSTFINNIAIKGAGMYIEGGIVNISNSCFESNICTDGSMDTRGGAIYWNSTSGKSSVTNCSFFKNGCTITTGKREGGAIAFGGKDYNWTSNSTTLNSFCDVEIIDCLFDQNSGKDGVDLFSNVSSNKITIKNTKFTSTAPNVIYSKGGVFTLNGCDNPNPQTFGSVTSDNVATTGTPSTNCVKTKSSSCPNIIACNPATAIATDAGCDKKSTLTATGPAGSIFYWYKKLSDATTHATNATKLWEDTSSTADPKYDLIDIKSDSVFYVVSNLDGCLTPTPVTIKYTCAPCPSPVLTFPSKACPKTEVRYATAKSYSDYAWTIPGVSGVDYEIVSGGTATSDTLIIKWLTKGDKVVRVAYKDNTGCTATSINTNITTVSDLSSASFTIQPSANSCQNTSIKYAANNTNSNFKWQITGVLGTDYEIVAGGKTTDDTLIIKWKTTGNHTVELDYTASGGCATTTAAKNTTKVVARPKLPLSPFQDTVQPICTDPFGSVLLNLPSLGNWTISSLPAVGNPKVVTNQNTYRFGDLLKKTKYKFFVVDTDGCFSDTTSEVTMNDIPGQPEIFGADTICMVNNLTLSAWTDKNKTKASTPNALNPWVSSDLTIATISNLGVVTSLNKSGKVRITYTDNANCTQFDSIVVAEKAVSGTTSFSVDTICVSDTKSIVLTGFSPLYKIQWQDSIAGSGVWNDIPNKTSVSFTIPTSIAGDYFYRAMVKNTFCSDNAVSKLVKVVVIGLPSPTFVDTIEPTCTVATGGVTSNMQYAGVWTIKATDLSGATKDTTATVLVNPFSLTIKGLKPGTYTFQVSNSKGCLSNASASIVINPQPTIPAKPVLDADSIYCVSNSYTLDKIYFKPKPTAAEKIRYFDQNGEITQPNLVVVQPNTKYKFVIDNGFCSSKDTLVTKIQMDSGPKNLIPLDITSLVKICAVNKPTFDSIFKLIPNPPFALPSGYSYFISPNPSGIPILPNNTQISANSGVDPYYYTLANQNGCKYPIFKSLKFNINEGPKNLNIKSSQLFCGFSNPTVAKLDTAATKASPTNSFVWYSSDISNSPLPSNTPLIPGTYYGAEKENPGCESVERKPVVVTIENFGPTTLDPNNVYTFCKGTNKIVSDLPISPYSTTNFVWLDSYKKEIKDKTIPLIQGTYYAAEFKNGCISDKSQPIEVKFESPIISITPSKLPTCGVGNGAFKIIGADPTYVYEWKKNNQVMPETGYQITNLPFDFTIKYSVIVKDLKGCLAYDTASFSDCEPPGIPHVITLNKDGKNDVFKLHYDTKYPKCKLSIFNRWGAMVYESKELPYKDDWDGKSNVAGTLGSGELPTGTYFYLIDKGDGSALESGYVELVK